MANLKDVRRKAVKITLLDGVERELKFTLNALAEMEDVYGSVENAFEALDKGSIKAVRFVLWAGLSWDEEENLSEKQVGALLDLACLEKMAGAVHVALTNDMPSPEETKKLAVVKETPEKSSDPN